MAETTVFPETKGTRTNAAAIVIPCYNEEFRWKDDYWSELAESGLVTFIFVDDGSKDKTAEKIIDFCSSHGGVAITLPANVGKSEALRMGLRQAVSGNSRVVGFLDADGAFPASEVLRLVELAEQLLHADKGSFDALWSARVMLAGRGIKRRASRHYIGRFIATLIAPWHGYEIYDTQSGFKLFCNDSRLGSCLNEPFETRWFLDVEVLQRWNVTQGKSMLIWEEPVMGWQDVAGSKMDKSQYKQLLHDIRGVHRGRVR